MERLLKGGLPLEKFVHSLAENPPLRAPGAAAYLFRTTGITPPALLHNLRHNDSLHEEVLVISIVTEEVPYVHRLKRADVVDLGQGFHQITLHYGFMDDPDLPQALFDRVVLKTGTDLETLTYFLGREAVQVTKLPGMARWREHLFKFMATNATSAAAYYHLPIDQTVEVGMAVEL